MQDNEQSWADNLPLAQGLYDPGLERDSCGVGFVASIVGAPTHSIVKDARLLLCNMTHRGAVGADPRDGDGAGVMTAIPHSFMMRETAALNCTLPCQGEYAVGNLYFNPKEAIMLEAKLSFETTAKQLGLSVLCWRKVPQNSQILGPVAQSKEPIILQPFVALADSESEHDILKFQKQLYLLRKQATHQIGIQKWFYICSLSDSTIVYKGQLAPSQVYSYFADLQDELYQSHFCLVHSRFSTNTFPSWDRAQPMRLVAHNGEINTLRGNKNWMRAREGLMKSEKFKSQLESLYPIVEPGGSDSAAFDNVLEMLVVNGIVTLPEAVMMMIPEAWQNQPDMHPAKRAFYEWSACLME